MISIPKGTRDILPEESRKWQLLERRFREVAAKYGYKEVRTPVFEHTELFERGLGDSTDIVNKEMYTFEIAGRSLSLKPEGTAGIVRAFIENKLYAGTMPAKYYYISPCYRYERMQRGRQREFHQLGIEIFGSSEMVADAEVITLGADYLDSLGLKSTKLRINSIGCPACREEHRKELKAFLEPRLGELCETCKNRYERNPMRILDCKNPSCGKITAGAPRMTEYLCEVCRSDFDKLRGYLDVRKIPYEVDPDIVRGLDYYCKTAFEITSNLLGAQSAVLGGGRYDGLMESLGGPQLPGVGFGLGIERLLLLMEEEGITIPEEASSEVFVACLGEEALLKGLEVADRLRSSGFRVAIDEMLRSLKGQLKYADRLGADYVIVIGDDEIARGVATLRDMKNSTQEEMEIAEIFSKLGRREP